MSEVTCSNKLQTFYGGETRDFGDSHFLACGSAETTVNVKVSNHSQL
jgi:hypothetical protein